MTNIEREEDYFYKVAKILLSHLDIDIHITIPGISINCLGLLCEYEQKTTLGVELLLNDGRTKVDKGKSSSFYRALRKIKSEDDYFYKIARMLLSHSDILKLNLKCFTSIWDDIQNFQKHVKNGDFEDVKRIITEGYRDVNTEIEHDEKLGEPLSIAIKSIQEENDNFSQISQMLLKCEDIDINFSVDLNSTLLE